jgi:hypothetical protein
VALDDVLDDALGSASEDLIAVLALHLLAVAILALGDAARAEKRTSRIYLKGCLILTTKVKSKPKRNE